MAGGRNRTITLGILFIAVLLAYQQRNTALQAAKRVADATSPTSSNPYYPTGQSHDTAPSTPRRRELPNEAFKLLSKIPSPFPYLYRFIIYTFYLASRFVVLLSPLVIQPILSIWHILLVILSPIIILLQALNYYLVLIPLGIALTVGRTLYPLYVFAAVAVLLGGVLGAFGGWLHWATSPFVAKAGVDVKGEMHREMKQLVDGKTGVRREQRAREERGKGRVREENRSDGLARGGASIGRVKQEELQDWRETVW